MTLNPPVLLIIEDDASTRSALERLFRKEFKVLLAESAEEAFKVIENNPDIAIILSDYMLPNKSGLELLSEIYVKFPSTVRIILTGHITVEELGAAMDKNIIHRVFLKPWENKFLLVQMHEAVKQHQLLKENYSLEQLALTDPITLLNNYRSFIETAEKEIERSKRSLRVFSLIMIDLDQFKSINDTKGHLEGDSLLRKVAEIMKGNLRNMDTVYRYAGDEFSVLLPETDKEKAFEVAERLREKSEQLLSGVTLSLGVSSFPDDADNLKELIHQADLALYEAKNKGKNKTVRANQKEKINK